MKNKNTEETKNLNDFNNSGNFEHEKTLNNFLKTLNLKIYIFLILIFINNFIMIIIFIPKKAANKPIVNEDIKKFNLDQLVYNNSFDINFRGSLQHQLEKEKDRPYLKDINLKRTFEKRLPLAKAINCKPHLSEKELIAFLSFLTNDTIYFETGSGCSSLIAKYYAKKSYAIEGCKEWYYQGIKNGLKDNLIFHDLKPDNPIWSYPGKNSNINDWKKYFQAYDKSYNADVILIDGRFKIATAMDMFDKIRDDTIVFLHEYQDRASYFVLEKYYQYIYHWGTLVAFRKKKDVKSIPLKIQKKYWDQFY